MPSDATKSAKIDLSDFFIITYLASDGLGPARLIKKNFGAA
jgi:hypothetical protein